MKRIFHLLILLFAITTNAQELSYYLPNNIQYDPRIPKPEEVIYHHVGEWHITHDRLVNYMKAIDAASDRVSLETMGLSYESRPQVLLIITSPANHARLEEIRQQHIKLTDPAQSGSVDITNMPIVVYIGHSIHGNEASGANASLLSAYYLAAAQGKEIDELLNNTIILFDPSFNPDGLQRFSTWANQHKSKNLVSDPASREFNEVWPGGRFNHYWFDLNRDWLPAVHRESQNRLEWFHRWKPNILTDHHEQGSSATFFFQPGVPSRVNPITPLKNQELTAKLGKFHAAYLDKIGSLYFTKESYDDFYYGKGSTYPDVNGAIGILFEQASSRGHLQETDNGLLTFPFTIRNQFTTTLSTLEGARQLRTEFLQWQKDFYTTAIKEAAASPVKGYVFGSQADKTKSAIFTEMLLRHQIQVYEPGKATAINGTQFTPGDAYYVPTDQPQFRLIQAIFTKTLEYKDSLFYDITAWTLPLAYGLSYAEVSATQAATLTGGNRILQPRAITGTLTGKSEYAYLFDWNEFYAPRALYELQQAGILTKVATTSFEVMVAGATRKFQPGSIMVPVGLQSMDSEKLFTLLKGIASSNGIEILPVSTGASITGSDLGSRNFAVTQKPRIAMIVGTGANATDAGEVWHLLDQRFNMPATHLEQGIFNQTDLTKYNTLIMVGGRYATLDKEKLKHWVEAGGTLILTEESINWAQQAGISTVGFKRTRPATDSATVIPYADLGQVRGAQQMSGAIFSADFDPTHPLAYGYPGKTVSLFKANNVFLEIPRNRNAAPFQYGKAPLQSGWLSQQNYAAMKNSAAVVVNAVGGGRVINIADNPNFRAFWLGGTKLMMNAIFFGRLIEGGSARSEE